MSKTPPSDISPAVLLKLPVQTYPHGFISGEFEAVKSGRYTLVMTVARTAKPAETVRFELTVGNATESLTLEAAGLVLLGLAGGLVWRGWRARPSSAP